ncbi:MAG: hypothetical protein P1P83_08825 [Bacteroidales bacterium]|nr:hypothetical protein [Bacteroidales bacterium]
MYRIVAAMIDIHPDGIKVILNNNFDIGHPSKINLRRVFLSVITAGQ